MTPRSIFATATSVTATVCGVAEDDGGDTQIPEALNTALVEALCYADLLDDEGVASRLSDALLTLCTAYEMALDDGSRYPGLYRLLASPRPDLRKMVNDPSPA